MKKNKSEKKQIKRTGETSKRIEGKTSGIMTPDQIASIIFQGPVVYESEKIASMSNDELLGRAKGWRRDLEEHSEKEEAGLALISRLYRDYVFPIKRLKDCLNEEWLINLKRSANKNSKLHERKRGKIVNQFMFAIGIIGSLSPTGKKQVYTDKELMDMYSWCITAMSPADTMNCIARQTRLDKHTIYKRLKKAGVEGVPSGNYISKKITE